MILDPTQLGWVVLSIPLLPLGAFLLLAAWWFLFTPPREKQVTRVLEASLVLSMLGSCLAAAQWFVGGLRPIEMPLRDWFTVGEYRFELAFLLDAPSVILSLLGGVLTGLIGRFSVNYLHREPGFLRFFLLLAVFATGFQLLVLGGSFDVLFMGWETVGLTSTLLIGYFHERANPVRAAMRALVTYRVCDVGMLLSAVVLHQTVRSATYSDVLGPEAWPGTATATPNLPATTVLLGFTLAAMGKSALLPTSTWLPRAMEGPTPSSALFYCALSIHAGVYLLLRCAPLLQASPLASALLVLLGLSTAAYGTLVGRVQSDAKNALAFASLTQVGLMVAELGLGYYRFALFHLVAHAILRSFQMLRSPSALRDALEVRHAGLGQTLPTYSWAFVLLPRAMRPWIYRLALERGYLEAVQHRLLVEPVQRLGALLASFEVWAVRSAGGAPSPSMPHPERDPGTHPDHGAYSMHPSAEEPSGHHSPLPPSEDPQ